MFFSIYTLAIFKKSRTFAMWLTTSKVLEINLRFERIASFQEFSFIGIKKVVF